MVGWFIAQAASIGPELEKGAASGVLTPAAAFVHYDLFRLAERQVSPRSGWLLGYAKPPVYNTQPSNS
ncbi:hypothetical protein P6B95_35845 [Streptomyces atratus]|uniref:hypothetical protein n=1 Tax=Streptomyces atratus TaxID=1893 RepID=UPI002AC34F0F|nr:hypothetical protein [Streptomyces atratus]WPW32231.1 hypothetical protein P6B95_35845 [Streptomyces atratus]